ncbi:MAG: nucleotidyltransferase family protein [Chthoniobacterales bacterium]
MENVAAVILAAGSSTRLGQPKQFLDWNGESLLRRAVGAASTAGCAPVIVVAGATPERIVAELHGTLADIVANSEWERGMGRSIRAGVQHLVSLDRSGAALVLLTCDQPFVDAAVIGALIHAWRKSQSTMVASRYAGTLGVPALFDRSCFADLLALPDKSGAKALLRARPSQVIDIPFEAGAFDIDTPNDYAQAKIAVHGLIPPRNGAGTPSTP